MSTNPSSIPEHDPAQDHAGFAPWRPGRAALRIVETARRRDAVPEIRRQAMAIIEELMAVTDPETEHEREQLRAFVEDHPGQPEVALAQHLLAVRPLLERLSAGEESDRTS